MKNFARSLPDGVAVDIGVDADGVKVALEAAGGDSISTARTLVGPQVAKKKLLEAAGYKVVVVPQPVWAGLASGKDKCQWLLDAVKAAAPAMAGRVAALQKKLDEPFNPYAE